MGVLQNLAQGEHPKLPQNAGDFLAQVYSKLPYFAYVEAKTKHGKQLLCGMEAVQHVWKQLENISPAEINLKDFQKKKHVVCCCCGRPETQTAAVSYYLHLCLVAQTSRTCRCP